MTENETNRRSFAIRANIGVLRLTRNWLRIAMVVVGLYATLPIVAPTLMKIGATGAANALYTVYSPMCHQFAFRSIFLFGEQAFYPREISDSELGSYEDYINEIDDFYEGYEATIPGFAPPDPDDTTTLSRSFWEPARFFMGNEQMGYKTAICARDVAIYLAVFAGVLIYSIPRVRRRLRPLPFWMYILIGIGPIALDGGSQLLSYEPWNLWAIRETEPFFRVATGATFGLMTAWLGLPYVNMSMRDTRRAIEHKLAQAGITI